MKSDRRDLDRSASCGIRTTSGTNTPPTFTLSVKYILPGFQLRRLLDAIHDLHGFLNYRIADGLELLILLQRYPLREVVGIGVQHILPPFIPQVIELSDSLVCCQFFHNLVHDGFHIGFQVSIDLLPGGTGKPVTETDQQGFYLGIAVDSAVDLRHNFCHRLPPLRAKLVTNLRLLLINMEHILCKDISCKAGSHLLDSLVR